MEVYFIEGESRDSFWVGGMVFLRKKEAFLLQEFFGIFSCILIHPFLSAEDQVQAEQRAKQGEEESNYAAHVSELSYTSSPTYWSV